MTKGQINRAESKFDKLSNEIAKDYEKKGKSKKEADKIGNATAYKIGVAKYGKRGMERKARAGRAKNAESFGADSAHGAESFEANMSYCRHENTADDLEDVWDKWYDWDEEDASNYEKNGRRKIVRIVREMANNIDSDSDFGAEDFGADDDEELEDARNLGYACMYGEYPHEWKEANHLKKGGFQCVACDEWRQTMDAESFAADGMDFKEAAKTGFGIAAGFTLFNVSLFGIAAVAGIVMSKK